VWYKNISGRFFGLVTKHAYDGQTDRRTDGQTDGQNYDSQHRASIAASRGKKRKDEKEKQKIEIKPIIYAYWLNLNDGESKTVKSVYVCRRCISKLPML